MSNVGCDAFEVVSEVKHEDDVHSQHLVGFVSGEVSDGLRIISC